MGDTDGSAHYLESELLQRVAEDAGIFEFLQEGSLDGIWYWDLQDQSQEWMSPKFWRTFGYEPGEKPHSPSAWQDMIHPDDLAVAMENFERHKNDPDHLYDQVVRYQHKDGSTVWVRCRGMMIRNDAGEPIRMLGAHVDVTPLEEAKLKLIERTDQLEQANLELQQFASIVAHDLKSPVRSVAMFMQFLREDHGKELKPDAVELIERAVASAMQMSVMIDDLLGFTRLESRSRPHSRVEMTQVLDEARRRIEAPISESGAEIEVGEMPAVHGDGMQLIQLMQNLLENAIKYRKPEVPPKLSVTAEREGDRFRFRVSDNGIGIDPKFHKRVFEIFERLHAKGAYPGTGVGLAVCRRVVDRHGGEIRVESELGEGSTFEFSLPAAES